MRLRRALRLFAAQTVHCKGHKEHLRELRSARHFLRDRSRRWAAGRIQRTSKHKNSWDLGAGRFVASVVVLYAGSRSHSSTSDPRMVFNRRLPRILKNTSMTTKPVVVRLAVVFLLILLAGFRPLSSQAQ